MLEEWRPYHAEIYTSFLNKEKPSRNFLGLEVYPQQRFLWFFFVFVFVLGDTVNVCSKANILGLESP